MSDPQFETLLTVGFLFESYSIKGETLRAEYGSGYSEGAVIGNPEGLRAWKLKIGALPNVEGQNLVNSGEHGLQTRFKYLFDFFVRHNVENARKPFWVRDPVSKRDYLAEIAEDDLDFRMLSEVVFSTGLTIRQRRVPGVESPSDPVTAENTQTI